MVFELHLNEKNAFVYNNSSYLDRKVIKNINKYKYIYTHTSESGSLEKGGEEM